LGVNRDLHGLVDAEAIDIQHGDSHAREALEARADRGNPFTQTILHGGELGQLTLPIGENTEGFDITVLVKVAVVAALEVGVNAGAVLVPEVRVGARVVVRVAKGEIEIAPGGLPGYLVLRRLERGTGVEVAVEADEIAESKSG
jgi:hypothetical protein